MAYRFSKKIYPNPMAGWPFRWFLAAFPADPVNQYIDLPGFIALG